MSRDNSSDGGRKALELFCAECLEEELRKRGEGNAEKAMIEKEKKKSATTEGVTAAKLPGQSGNCTLAARQSEVSRLTSKSKVRKDSLTKLGSVLASRHALGRGRTSSIPLLLQRSHGFSA